MNRDTIFELLQACVLAVDGADMPYLIDNGFNPQLAKMGLQLCSYLKSKEVVI